MIHLSQYALWQRSSTPQPFILFRKCFKTYSCFRHLPEYLAASHTKIKYTWSLPNPFFRFKNRQRQHPFSFGGASVYIRHFRRSSPRVRFFFPFFLFVSLKMYNVFGFLIITNLNILVISEYTALTFRFKQNHVSVEIKTYCKTLLVGVDVDMTLDSNFHLVT